MTYTLSTMQVPPAVFNLVHETLAECGYDHLFIITPDKDGRPAAAIDMNGIMLVTGVEDRRDMFIHSGGLSDLMVQSNKEAFTAGFHAAALEVEARGRANSCLPGKIDAAWGRYQPSSAIMELQDAISREDYHG